MAAIRAHGALLQGNFGVGRFADEIRSYKAERRMARTAAANPVGAAHGHDSRAWRAPTEWLRCAGLRG